MCGIAGFLNPGNNHQKTEKEKYEILRKIIKLIEIVWLELIRK